MSTESTTTSAPKLATPAPPSVVTTIEKDLTWFHAHILAVVFAVVMLAGTIIGGVALFESLIEKHDARVAAAQLAKEGVDTATQSALLTQLQQMQATDAARDAQYQTTIKNLAAQMLASRAQTAQQIVTDGTLTVQAAAARLVEQTKAAPSDVTVSNDLVTMTLPLTRIIVADLDLLPQAQADVNNLQSQLDAQKILTSDAKVEAGDANKIIQADKTELIATIKADNSACQVRVDAQASKDRKRGFWYSLASLVIGFGVRSAI
jgi:hypothetical protein